MTFGFEIDHVQIAIPKSGENDARIFFRDLLALDELPKPSAMESRGGCWFATAPVLTACRMSASVNGKSTSPASTPTAGLRKLFMRCVAKSTAVSGVIASIA